MIHKRWNRKNIGNFGDGDRKGKSSVRHCLLRSGSWRKPERRYWARWKPEEQMANAAKEIFAHLTVFLRACLLGFPGGSDGKESTCNVGDLGSISKLGRSPGEGYGNPFQYSCLENPHGQGSLVGYSSWGCIELYTTEWISIAQHMDLWVCNLCGYTGPCA